MYGTPPASIEELYERIVIECAPVTIKTLRSARSLSLYIGQWRTFSIVVKFRGSDFFLKKLFSRRKKIFKARSLLCLLFFSTINKTFIKETIQLFNILIFNNLKTAEVNSQKLS